MKPKIAMLEVLSRLDNPTARARILAAALREPKEVVDAYIAGKLGEEKAAELAIRIEELVAPPAAAKPIPEAQGREKATRRLQIARKALRGAARACRVGGGDAFCVKVEENLARLDELDNELAGDEKPADDEQDE